MFCSNRFIFVNMDACMASQAVTIAVLNRLEVRHSYHGLLTSFHHLDGQRNTPSPCSCGAEALHYTTQNPSYLVERVFA